MSPRAASRLESLGFGQVYDYAAGKADWIAAGLPIEGEAASALVIGKLARTDAPTCRLDDTVGGVRERAMTTGWDQAVVLDDRGVLLGWLGADAMGSDPDAEVTSAMLEGPVTFRPNWSVDETASWMDDQGVASVLVTSPHGRLLGVVRRSDLDVAPSSEASGDSTR
jgi:CBS domain-containing protein